MLLTQEERLRFINYLRNSAASCNLIITQMEKASIPDVLIHREKIKEAAYLGVAEDLESVEVVDL